MAENNNADRPQGMLPSELTILKNLISQARPAKVLEIGMANGSSSLEILQLIHAYSGISLTSIDPFQLEPTDNGGFGGNGVLAVKNAGFSQLHRLMPEPDYTALPKLIAAGEKFEFIFIDGYHSFDYAFIDYFYADLLLSDGGILAFHDSSCDAVYKVCSFLMRNKPYELIGPSPAPLLHGIIPRLLRRMKYILNNQSAAFAQRRLQWCSLAAFRKISGTQCEQFRLNNF
jgi:hypothetical protein